MTKKDVLEIRHLFAPKECSISKIRGCYVDGDCNKVATINEEFDHAGRRNIQIF